MYTTKSSVNVKIPKIISVRKENLNKLGYENFEEWISNSKHLYIGRYNHHIEGTFQSKWHNPFSLIKYGRTKCIKEYEEYILSNEELLNDLYELNGKILGCWCKPESCHGDILIKLFKSKFIE